MAQVNNGLSDTEKQDKVAELAANKKLIASKDQELIKLRHQQANNPTNTDNNKDNSKLNWAIGLGIAAVVIGLLSFLFLLRKQNKT